jgi:hypothetical protein
MKAVKVEAVAVAVASRNGKYLDVPPMGIKI